MTGTIVKILEAIGGILISLITIGFAIRKHFRIHNLVKELKRSLTYTREKIKALEIALEKEKNKNGKK